MTELTITFNLYDLEASKRVAELVLQQHPGIIGAPDENPQPKPAPKKQQPAKGENTPPPPTDADMPGDLKEKVAEKPQPEIETTPERIQREATTEILRSVQEVKELAAGYLTAKPAGDERNAAREALVGILKKNFNVPAAAQLKEKDVDSAYQLLSDYIEAN